MLARLSLICLASAVSARLPASVGRDFKPDSAGAAARRQHAAATLNQLAEFCGDDLACSVAELGAAYDLLGSTRSKDPVRRARQITCQQLAQLCRELDGEPSLSAFPHAWAAAAKAWLAWALMLAASKDPRHAAMQATFERELHELSSSLGPLEVGPWATRRGPASRQARGSQP